LSGYFKSAILGVPTTNKLLRKLEEMPLELWLEDEMCRHFGSQEQAKREIFARSASFNYLGNGQYGFAASSEYYFGKPLSSYTSDDAGKAALLAGSPRRPGTTNRCPATRGPCAAATRSSR
jgi:penicillin-binding protein 1A